MEREKELVESKRRKERKREEMRGEDEKDERMKKSNKPDFQIKVQVERFQWTVHLSHQRDEDVCSDLWGVRERRNEEREGERLDERGRKEKGEKSVNNEEHHCVVNFEMPKRRIRSRVVHE